jgi:Protein of unknown function (DUF1592)/Protein of unknown function (DUF1588)/Protein of unknown function (DUF1595)/Protein of unknown function (DUF1585)/Protein of unknown function (DUF1587)
MMKQLVKKMAGCRYIGLGLGIASLSALAAAVPESTRGATSEPPVTGGPPMLRRLTEAQYRATVADVFGPDIAVAGRFERGLRSDGLVAVGTSEAGLSPFSIEQYDIAARGIAAQVVSEEYRATLLPCEPETQAAFDVDCARQVVQRYAPQLFRRPLGNDELANWVGRAEAAQQQLGGFYNGLEFALAGMLVSPDFLLRIEQSEPLPRGTGEWYLDPYSRATRLSYFLTGSAPDAQLLAAAGSGALDNPDGLATEVDRLLADPRFEGAVREFFADMLQFDLFDDLAKDPLIYPAYNSTVAADAQEQTLRTITAHLLENQGDYRELFTIRAAPLTRSLGIVYRQPVAVRNGWMQSEFPERSGRAGIQSQLAFLALHSHPGRSSPTLRGKAIREVFMCQHVPDPPVDVDFVGINDDANTARPTARDRLEAHRTQPACKACHTLMDPLGLTLERYDGLGAFRTRENGAVINVSGSLDGREFEAAPGLGQALRDHPETTRCLVKKVYRTAVGRAELSEERDYLRYLEQAFAGSGYRLPALMRTIATSEAFYRVTPPEAEGAVAYTDTNTGGER